MLSVVPLGMTTDSRSARSRTRGVMAPSSSPTRKLPGPPNWIRPGAIQSAAQLTRHPTVRVAPIRSAISSSFNPFWTETTTEASVR